MSLFATLPDELVLMILAHCDLDAQLAFIFVARAFRRLVFDKALRLVRPRSSFRLFVFLVTDDAALIVCLLRKGR